MLSTTSPAATGADQLGHYLEMTSRLLASDAVGVLVGEAHADQLTMHSHRDWTSHDHGRLLEAIGLAGELPVAGAGEAEPPTGEPRRRRHAYVPLALPNGAPAWLAAAFPGSEMGRRGPIDDEPARRLAAVAPLVTALLAADARRYDEHLDGLVMGLSLSAPASFLVAEDGEVLGQSEMAAQLVEDGSVIAVFDRRLRAASVSATQDLLTAIGDVARRGAAEPEAERGVNLEGETSGRCWMASVRSLATLLTGRPLPLVGRRRQPVCWVALRHVGQAQAPCVKALRDAFGFSAKEAELVRALTLGRTASAHAEERGVTVDAANYHLRNIYQKTGCRRQSELVLLVSGTLGLRFGPCQH